MNFQDQWYDHVKGSWVKEKATLSLKACQFTLSLAMHDMAGFFFWVFL